jgi:hypothetical protein
MTAAAPAKPAKVKIESSTVPTATMGGLWKPRLSKMVGVYRPTP